MKLALAPRAHATSLYRDLADQMLRLIESGTFRPGERLPSVRELARRKDVSITTVLEAYRLLEDGGYIETRPQSGTFVRPRLLRLPEIPDMSSPPPNPRPVGNRELMSVLLRDSGNPRMTQLGAATPPPELLPTEKLNRALSRHARRGKWHGCGGPTRGTQELRVQIARRALASGCNLTPADIVTTNGCQEAIYLALGALCRPGDTVAVESPTYYGFLQAIDLLGLRVLEIATCPRDGIDVDAIRRAIRRHRIRAFVLSPSFSNPTGSLMPAEAKRELAELLARRNIPLIEDDIAGDLGHDCDRPRTVKSFDRKGLVLLCSSFSKTLSPDYRVGWIAPGRFIEEVEHRKAVANIATAPLPQLAVADFLSNGGHDRHLRKMRRILSHNSRMMIQAVAESFPEGTRITRPLGGFVIWIELPRGTDALDLREKAHKAGITIAPGPLFSAKGAFGNFIRLNASTWSPRIARSITKLGRLAR